MPYLIKTAPKPIQPGERMHISVPAYYDGENADVGERAYLWFSEIQGGEGLAGVGNITEKAVASNGYLSVEIEVQDISVAQPYKSARLEPYKNVRDGSALSELSRKIVFNAHNKIAHISQNEAEELDHAFAMAEEMA